MSSSVTGLLIYAAADAPHFDCPICMNHIKHPNKKILTSCSHLFCENCVLHTQKTHPHSECIACPMCRMQLRKLTPREIPLEEIPLCKIRNQWARHNCNAYFLQKRIETAPERIAYYMHLIDQIQEETIRAESELLAKAQLLLTLEEQISKRQRPRKAVHNVPPPQEGETEVQVI